MQRISVRQRSYFFTGDCEDGACGVFVAESREPLPAHAANFSQETVKTELAEFLRSGREKFLK